MDALILRALAKAPADRFQSAAEMAAALRALTKGEVRGPPVARPRRRRVANPWIPATISALAIASFALGLAAGRTLPFAAGPGQAVTSPR